MQQSLTRKWYAAVKFGSRGRVGPQVVGPSQFWMSGAEVPEPNADTLKLLEAYSYLPHSFKTLRWSDEEDAKLKELVLTALKVSSSLLPASYRQHVWNVKA